MRRKIRTASMVIAALLVVSAGSVGAAPAAAANARSLWEQGNEAAKNKRYAEAVETFTRAIRVNRGEIGIESVAWLFNDRGLAYLNLQQYDDAADDFGNAISLDKGNAAFYSNRGLAYLAMRQYDDAIADFSKAIALSPVNAAYYNSRGVVFLKMQSFDEAIADFSKAVEADPRSAPAYSNRGMAYKGKLAYDKALQNFDKVIEIVPKDHSAGYQKAAIYALLGKIDVACTWLEIAIENGYNDWAAIKNSPDFDGVRKTDCYRKIMAGK
jgi:tetratricopeptide (TPR) repeat protein